MDLDPPKTFRLGSVENMDATVRLAVRLRDRYKRDMSISAKKNQAAALLSGFGHYEIVKSRNGGCQLTERGMKSLRLARRKKRFTPYQD